MGDLDRLLTYPVNSLYFLLITKPELHAFGNLTTGLVFNRDRLVSFKRSLVCLGSFSRPGCQWLPDLHRRPGYLCRAFF